MDEDEMKWRWERNEPIEGAAFTRGDRVRVVDGPWIGEEGHLTSLLALEPMPSYLVALRSGTNEELTQSQLRSAHFEHPRSALAELQHWYACQTNTNWEHDFGINIQSLDNPGWRLEIDLTNTELVHHPFTEIRNLDTEHEWISCSVREGKFVAATGPLMLEEAIRTFLGWASTAPNPRA